MKLTFFREEDRIEGLAIEEEPVSIDGSKAMLESLDRGSGLSDNWLSRSREALGTDVSTADDQFFALYLDPTNKSLVVPLSNKV